MKIGIIGAGAIGGWVAAKLAGGGHDVAVLARGATLAAISTDGLILCEGDLATTHLVKASDDPAALGIQDILIITVKAQALPALAPQLAAMIGPNTIIIPMLNGVPWWFLGEGDRVESVDPIGSIAAAFPHAQVVGSVLHAAANCPSPGVVELRYSDRIIIGEPSGGLSARIDMLAAMLVASGLPGIASDDVRTDIWFKLWGNMTMNPISALTLSTMDKILDDPFAESFILRIMDEAKAVGAKIGCVITQSGADRNAVTRKLGAVKTSMLQDTEAGRSLELDALVAAPREIAARFGVPTPNMDALLGLIRLMGKSRGLY